jgi:cytochrome c oxidase subunit 1
VISGIMRLELAEPGLQLSAPELAIDAGCSGADEVAGKLPLERASPPLHGLIMVFFMVMPALIGGFGNWFVPLMIGAPDMAIPRMNNVSVLADLAGRVHPARPVDASSRARQGVERRRRRLDVLYPPLSGATRLARASRSTSRSSRSTSRVAASILGAINFIATILNMRAPGMTLHKMPLFAWSVLVTAFLLAARAAGSRRVRSPCC